MIDRLRSFMISLALLNPPNENIINLSPRASWVGEEIDLRRFPYDGSILNPDMVIRIKTRPKKNRKIGVRPRFVIGEFYDMPLSCYMTRGVEEWPELG